MKLEYEVSNKRDSKTTFYVIISIVIIIIIVALTNNNNNTTEVVDTYSTEFNNATIIINEPHKTIDEDTGEVIVNVPLTVKNDGEYSVTVKTRKFYFEDTNYFPLFDILVSGFGSNVKSGEEENGEVSVTLDTRDIDSVNEVRAVFVVTDLYTEEEKEIDVTLNVN